MTMRRSVLAVALLVATGALGALSPAAAGALRDFDGQERTLEGLVGKGRWTVVMFWASDCPICNQEAPAWALFDERRRDRDAHVVGVSIDGQSGFGAARAFRERHLLDFPNLIGEPQDVARLFAELARHPWLGTPSFLVYDPEGELRARHVGALPVDRLETFIEKSQSP
jgi:peroxiredoxin